MNTTLPRSVLGPLLAAELAGELTADARDRLDEAIAGGFAGDVVRAVARKCGAGSAQSVAVRAYVKAKGGSADLDGEGYCPECREEGEE